MKTFWQRFLGNPRVIIGLGWLAIVLFVAIFASVLSPRDVVVFESTVYPGLTEEICGPILADASGLTVGTFTSPHVEHSIASFTNNVRAQA